MPFEKIMRQFQKVNWPSSIPTTTANWMRLRSQQSTSVKKTEAAKTRRKARKTKMVQMQLPPPPLLLRLNKIAGIKFQSADKISAFFVDNGTATAETTRENYFCGAEPAPRAAYISSIHFPT